MISLVIGLTLLISLVPGFLATVLVMAIFNAPEAAIFMGIFTTGLTFTSIVEWLGA